MKKKIKIQDLIVNPKNFRFNPVQSEELAIDLMLEEKSPEILVLAQHIAEYGLDEAKELRVLKSGNKFLVLDGNRRTTAIKCLDQPALAKNKNLEKEFLKIKAVGNLPEAINCFVYEDEESASVWIKLDHTGKNKGAGQDKWEHDAQQRFDSKFGGKFSPALQALELLKKNKLLTGKEKLNITTLDRILSNPEARSFLGVNVKKGNLSIASDKAVVLDRLKKLFEKEIKVADVYNTTAVKKFMEENFGSKLEKNNEDSHPSLFEDDVEINDIEEVEKEKDSSVKVKKTSKSKPMPSGLFFGSEVPYNLDNKALRNLYNELKDISVSGFPNATHDLLRSFLECALAEFLTEIGEYSKIQKDDKHNPKLSEMLGHLLSNKTIINDNHIASNLQDIKTDWSSPYSLERMNKVNHNKNYSSVESDVRSSWSKLEPLFKIILNKDKK